MPKSSPVYLEKRTHRMVYLSVRNSVELAFLALAADFVGLRRFCILALRLLRSPAFLRREAALHGAADAPVRVRALKDDLARRGSHRIRLVSGQAQCAGLFHEPIDAVQLPDHFG